MQRIKWIPSPTSSAAFQDRKFSSKVYRRDSPQARGDYSPVAAWTQHLLTCAGADDSRERTNAPAAGISHSPQVCDSSDAVWMLVTQIFEIQSTLAIPDAKCTRTRRCHWTAPVDEGRRDMHVERSDPSGVVQESSRHGETSQAELRMDIESALENAHRTARPPSSTYRGHGSGEHSTAADIVSPPRR